MLDRQSPDPVLILLPVIGLIFLTIAALVIGAAIDIWLIPISSKSAGIGLIFILPVCLLWKKTFAYLGMNMSGPEWRK